MKTGRTGRRCAHTMLPAANMRHCRSCYTVKGGMTALLANKPPLKFPAFARFSHHVSSGRGVLQKEEASVMMFPRLSMSARTRKLALAGVTAVAALGIAGTASAQHYYYSDGYYYSPPRAYHYDPPRAYYYTPPARTYYYDPPERYYYTPTYRENLGVRIGPLFFGF
jgi:hypothetical protein